MWKNSIISAALIFAGLFTAACAKAQTSVDAAKIYGDWTGESMCVDKQKFPVCKDEKVVYHFSKSTADAAKIHLAADKIVGGVNELMGEFECAFDAAKNTITAEFTINQTHGIWEFAITGDEMTGTLKMLPDQTLARRIKVKKSK